MIISDADEAKCFIIAGKFLAGLKSLLRSLIQPGISSYELELAADTYLSSANSKVKYKLAASFKGQHGLGKIYKHILCVSVNDVVVHGIPSKDVVLKTGDLVSIDAGISCDGYHTDSAFSVIVGDVDSKLVIAAKEALIAGISMAVAGNHVSDISFEIQQAIRKNGFHVMREFSGHGVGKQLHEDPQVKNCGRSGRGAILKPGMVLAIEPVISETKCKAVLGEDSWQYITSNGCLAAHYEDTVIVTESDPIIVT